MSILLPVGHLLGSEYDEATGEATQRVRVGPDVIHLDGSRFAVWSLAHGTSTDLPDGADARDALLEDGLLASVSPASIEEFARGHRLVPLMLGLGNLPESPDVYQIGLPGHPLLHVSAAVFDVFRWSPVEDDLWSAGLATAGRLGTMEPVALLDELLSVVHTLLAASAVCLDTAA
ncbi:hypothetical protein [Cryptosporangium phraense]|uniref:Uncharacterized protein n=1 Tax=Cryptosporangium phraense TaxID=2593070 RepID=A0A545AT99_9ACTN|nr:hypothetical protein [Cryptosporangium phraense]TQS43825.1 hypothetical protein FL583_17525 [Cryptosporangium phraense]